MKSMQELQEQNEKMESEKMKRQEKKLKRKAIKEADVEKAKKQREALLNEKREYDQETPHFVHGGI